MKIRFSVTGAKACLSRWEPIRSLRSGVKITIANTVHVSKDGRTCAMVDLAKFLSTGGVNEEGRNVPPRPLVLDYTRENKDWLLQQVHKNLEWVRHEAATDGNKTKLYNYEIVLHTKPLAAVVRQHFQQWVRSGNYYKSHVPNAPYTIEKKGSDTPLVDTGQLANAIVARPVGGFVTKHIKG